MPQRSTLRWNPTVLLVTHIGQPLSHDHTVSCLTGWRASAPRQRWGHQQRLSDSMYYKADLTQAHTLGLLGLVQTALSQPSNKGQNTHIRRLATRGGRHQVKLTSATCQTKPKPKDTLCPLEAETYALMTQHAATKTEWQGISPVQLLSGSPAAATCNATSCIID